MLNFTCPLLQSGPVASNLLSQILTCLQKKTKLWSIWKMRNKICFEVKKFHNPLEIVCHAGVLMKFWAGLMKDSDKEGPKALT